MAKNKSAEQLAAALAVQELELTLLREQRSCEDWELLSAARELEFMARVAKATKWPPEYEPLAAAFDAALQYASEMIQKRDTTRIGAAQTRLEQATFALRDLFYQ
jgi:hypothetical protein